MVGFALRVFYGTVATPAMKAKWDENEDGICKLCDRGTQATIQHILSGCPVSLQQGRYTWRHDKVLKQIHDQISYHVEHRVNNPKRSVRDRIGNIQEFVGAGKTDVRKKVRSFGEMGILTTAKDWLVLADLDKQLRFPQEIQVKTQLRPAIIIYSKTIKRIIWWELTCPSEERISESHELKLDRYANLQVDCQNAGWSCYNMAIEVGARGVVAESLRSAAISIGIRGRSLKKLVREGGQEALHCSKWIYWLSERKEWDMRVCR